MIIDGRKIANDIKAEIAITLTHVTDKPKISAIILGEHPSSMSYLKMLEKTCNAVGFSYEIIALPLDTPHDKLIQVIDEKNTNDSIKGVLVQLPLPAHIDESAILMRILPEKDLDGFNPVNAGYLFKGEPGVRPCTPLAVMTILSEMGISLEGKHVVVVGRSNIVGKPLAIMLLEKNATVTICHSRTSNLSNFTKSADIVIVAVGKPKFLTKEMVTPKTIVIDVGTNMQDGKLVGDADFDALVDYVAMITPVPGGVGPVTNAVLLKNAL